MIARLHERLEFLYGREHAADLAWRVESLAEAYRTRIPERLRAVEGRWISERDVILITYPDQVHAPGEAPLRTLSGFLNRHAARMLSAVHVLPFFPWSSDDGFSVTDYLEVDSRYGTWADIARVGEGFELMFDAVINHMSAGSAWFRRFLEHDPAFEDFFLTIEGDPDLSAVVRPRALPLLTEFATGAGPRRVWTTFSADQVDLNLRNPKVLLSLLEVLLIYLSRGARFIRLDAIAYLWKEMGTPCVHLPQTHEIIRVMRSLLDAVAPRAVLITETNVAHSENISYFGDGTDEARMVYNFALPPLVVHAFRQGEATALTRWASELSTPTPEVTFFNFLASHDGIGLNPARGLLTEEDIERLVRGTLRRNGLISYKHNPDGSRGPYEMNINYLDALADPEERDTGESLARRLLTAHGIMLALPGVPGIYFHSLFGSRGDRKGAEATGQPRRINREKMSQEILEKELAAPAGLRSMVYQGFGELLNVRRRHKAFDPFAEGTVLSLDPRVFAIRREACDGGAVLSLHNVSGSAVGVDVSGTSRCLVGLGAHPEAGRVELEPYGTAWMELPR
jgi:sucrose phosphorylase